MIYYNKYIMEVSMKKQKRSQAYIVGIVVMAIIGLSCIGCFALGMIGDLSPTHIATAGATETAKPMDTPVPTSFPTKTPKPTAIPTVTLKPTPVPPTDMPEPIPEGPPPEVVVYMLESIPKIQAIGDSLTSLGTLLMDPNIGDDSWTIAVVANILVIQETHKELMEMEVPPEVVEIHAAVLDTTGDFSKSMDYVITGIDNMNAEDLEKAISLMNSGNEKIQKATKMLEEYMAQFG